MEKIVVTTLTELQIWIEGKFNLLVQSQSTTAEDVRQVRSRVHDLGNDISRLLALDIEGKLQKLEDADKQHESSIERFSKEAAERRGAVAALKVVYMVTGGVIGAAVAVFTGLIK